MQNQFINVYHLLLYEVQKEFWGLNFQFELGLKKPGVNKLGYKADAAYKTFFPLGIKAKTIYFPSINYTTKQRYIQQNVIPKNLSSGMLSLDQNF